MQLWASLVIVTVPSEKTDNSSNVRIGRIAAILYSSLLLPFWSLCKYAHTHALTGTVMQERNARTSQGSHILRFNFAFFLMMASGLMCFRQRDEHCVFDLPSPTNSATIFQLENPNFIAARRSRSSCRTHRRTEQTDKVQCN
jgi:hypothetical protein